MTNAGMRRHPGVWIVCLALTVTLSAACAQTSRKDSSPEPSQAIFFPTMRQLNSRAEAQVGGMLIEREGCLLLQRYEDQGEPIHLILWQAGHSFADGVVLGPDGQTILRLGDELVGGGGWADNREHAEWLVREPIPERCRAPSGYAMLWEPEQSV